MIIDKETLNIYLKKDKNSLGIERKYPHFWADEIWRFQIYLRKHEYYLNSQKNKLALLYYKSRHHYLGIKLGFSIPCNVFGAGLRINHYGYIVINSKAEIGEFCDIHQGVNIGESVDAKAPKIGSNVWIGPGAKLFGDIYISDNIMIGANSVVNKSFTESDTRIAGVPAKAVSTKGNYYKRNNE